MSKEFNIITATDSYKIGHYGLYMGNTEKVYSYLEARIGARFNETVFFGLQSIIKKYLEGVVVTKEKIDEAEELINGHLGAGVFNRAGWEHILNAHGGRLPVCIRAVKEGVSVPTSNVMLTIVNTDTKVPWLTNYLETILMQMWYPMTVATLSRECKILMKDYLGKTSDSLIGLNFMLHDFGMRGSTSIESCAIAGAAHLINFYGTDTIPALIFPKLYYGETGVVGYSVYATEHSIMTSRMEAGEFEVVENILKAVPNGILSVVIDSYDYERFIKTCGTRFKDIILTRNGKLVFRPDSGDPIAVTLKCLELLGDAFGTTQNSKGYRVLNEKVGILWGDGIDYYGIRNILHAMKNQGWASSNIVFGMGGGLHQHGVERDTQRFAFKCSAQFYNGAWHDVFKRPKDESKASKRGRLVLTGVGGKMHTIQVHGEEVFVNDLLEKVFEDGVLLREQTFENIRELAEIK